MVRLGTVEPVKETVISEAWFATTTFSEFALALP